MKIFKLWTNINTIQFEKKNMFKRVKHEDRTAVPFASRTTPTMMIPLPMKQMMGIRLLTLLLLTRLGRKKL